jgi:ATP-binding cassette subfamily C (CFTR/MRP) protein 1
MHNNYSLFRFSTMFRGGMIALIYDKTLVMKEGAFDESAAMSLMSSDVDQITFALKEVNEIWARLLELCIGLPLLTRQLGWVSMVPLIVVISECPVFFKLISMTDNM